MRLLLPIARIPFLSVFFPVVECTIAIYMDYSEYFEITLQYLVWHVSLLLLLRQASSTQDEAGGAGH